MRTSAGLSLVEVLVATTLVLLSVASALSLVARGRGAYRSVETRARLEETARAALDMLAYEVRLAGYLGQLVPGSTVQGSLTLGSAPSPDLSVSGGCVDSLAVDTSTPLAGADGAYEAAPGVPLGCPPSPHGRVVPGSDTLVIRRAGVGAAGPDAGRLQLESTREAGRLMSDGSRELGDNSLVHDLEASVFYVSGDATGANGRPALRRKRLVGGSEPAFQDEELVPGIEDLQVEFARAASADGSGEGTGYLPIDAFPDGTPVQSVRLWVLVRDDTGEAMARRLPALAYANRQFGDELSRHPRLLAYRTIDVRNSGSRP
jgi:type IV pilus assembly protein PilW